MAYQALYRQWRPVDFSSVVSQEGVIRTLRNQVTSGRIAHAYLFCGSRGTGKTSTAKILSRAINCEHPIDGDPCGECPTCRMLLADESLDVTEIDAASNNGVEEMRELRENVKYPPQNARYKVYIVDEVHMLSTSAFNALLKTLEEPPAHVVFILATTEPQKLPATILSRCQRFDFGRIPAAKIAGRLRQAVEGASATATDAALNMIARAAEGGMRDALSILDMCLGYQSDVTEELVHRVLGTSDRSFLFRVADSLQKQDAAAIMGEIDELMRSGREPSVFSRDMSQHLRSLLMAKCCPDGLPGLLDLTEEAAGEYKAQAQGFTEGRLLKMIDLFMSVETELRYASSPRIALETASVKACLRTSEADPQALADRIQELEQKVSDLQSKLASGNFQAQAAPAPKKAPAKEQAEKQQDTPAQAQLTPTGKSGADAWKDALNLLKKEEPGIAAFLSFGKMLSCTDGLFRWQPNPGMEFYCDNLNAPARRDKISDVLTRVMGTAGRFEAVRPGSSTTPEQDASDEALLKSLTDTFGAANVLVQEKANG